MQWTQNIPGCMASHHSHEPGEFIFWAHFQLRNFLLEFNFFWIIENK